MFVKKGPDGYSLKLPNLLTTSDAHVNIIGKYVKNNETISETIIDNDIPVIF